ncbi:NTP transferase domain-containing protein [Agrobacterium tumefaciens]
MAPYKGKPLIERSAQLLKDERVAARIAIVGVQQQVRANALRALGWNVSICDVSVPGMAASLAEGIRLAEACHARAALIVLADMPEVSDRHLVSLRKALTPGLPAVCSRNGDTLMPPAIFSDKVFHRIMELRGDQGARSLLDALPRTATVDIAFHEAVDIDTVADLEVAAALLAMATIVPMSSRNRE